MNNRVLLVDDDYNLISTYFMVLKKRFEIKTATSADQAMQLIEKSPPFAVVATDYSMPKMNGIDFLNKVENHSPNTVRLMMTAYADLQLSVEALNRGNIYRFLTKPFRNETLIRTVEDSIQKYMENIKEKELLDKTLKGVIKLILDVLSIVNNSAFQYTLQLREYAKKIASEMKLNNQWEIEIAVLLSQTGCITLSPGVFDRQFIGNRLNQGESKLLMSHPQVGMELLRNIPRMDKIAEAIAYQYMNYDGSGSAIVIKKGDDLPVASRILKVTMDFCKLLRDGNNELGAIEKMSENDQIYDPNAFKALSNLVTS